MKLFSCSLMRLITKKLFFKMYSLSYCTVHAYFAAWLTITINFALYHDTVALTKQILKFRLFSYPWSYSCCGPFMLFNYYLIQPSGFFTKITICDASLIVTLVVCLTTNLLKCFDIKVISLPTSLQLGK